MLFHFGTYNFSVVVTTLKARFSDFYFFIVDPSLTIRASIDSLSSLQGAVFNAFYICGHCN